MNYDLDKTMMGKLRDVTKERDELVLKLAQLTEAAKNMVRGFVSDDDRTIAGYYALVEVLNDQQEHPWINPCGEIKVNIT